MDAETGQRGFLLTGNDEYLVEATNLAKRARTVLDRLADRLQLDDNPLINENDVRNLQSLVQKKIDHMGLTVETFRNEGLDSALELVTDETGKEIMKSFRAFTGKIEEAGRSRLDDLKKEEEDDAFLAQQLIVWGIIPAGVTMGLMAFSLTSSIGNPLAELSKASRRLSQGDISASLENSDRDDEIGDLQRSFAAMVTSFHSLAGSAKQIAQGDLSGEVPVSSDRDVLGNALGTMRQNLRDSIVAIQEVTQVLAASASEISSSTSQMAASASETASSVGQTTSTVEEVRQTVEVSRQKAANVSSEAQRSAEIAQAGRTSVEDTVDDMRLIQKQMNSIAQTIVHLSEQSQAVGEIVSVVADLAEQSNLLAVNASIEAARAGEHGRGFSVVAQEIRALAEQSKEATTEVRSILGETQKAVSGAVMATEQGGKAVAAGMASSKKADDAIRSLSDIIEEAAQAALQIAASSQQQSAGMDQVASAMQNIKEASGQNVAGTKQAEEAARSLDDIGKKLRGMLDSYQV